MLTILLGIVIAIVIAILITRIKGTSDKVFAIGCSVVIGGFGGLISSVEMGDSAPREVSSTQVSLVSLNNSRSIEGSFFLLAGTIGEETNYHYWYADQGGFREGELSGRTDPLIVEEERSDAFLQTNTDYCNSTLWAICTRSVTTYEFHIPKGSIQTEFILQ